MMKVKRVGIIGAGPAGLAAIKACLEEGLEPTAFEREDEFGGVWVYRDVDNMRYPEAAAVYKCLKTNTSKAFFGFTDFPSPAEWPPFVSHDKVLKYLEDDYETTGRWRLRYLSLGNEHEDTFDAIIVCSGFYAEANLPQYPGLELFKGDVSLGNAYRENTKYSDKKVLVVEDDYETTGRWRLRYLSLGNEHEDTFDAIIVCSGFYAEANLPQYPGLELFKGDVSLGNAYRENTKYSDKKVLVVGSGISAGDIATDISNTTTQAFISARHGFNVSPVIDSHGWPFDLYIGTRYVQSLTPSVFERLSSRERHKRFRVDELGLGGLSQNACQPSSFVLNDNFINQVLCGKILPKPEIDRFTKNGVLFTDGSKVEDLDAALFCTGYRSTLPFIDERVIPESTAERDLYLHVFPVHLKHHTLACVGFFKVYSIGSPICVIDMQTRWIARIFNGKSILPSKTVMLKDVRKRRHTEHTEYGKDVFRVYAVPYMDRLATYIGCYPSLASLLLTDPRLSLHMFFGPVVPASYRLVGPHRWEGARENVLNSWNTTFEGTRSKTVKNGKDFIWGYFKIWILLLTAAVIMSFCLPR